MAFVPKTKQPPRWGMTENIFRYITQLHIIKQSWQNTRVVTSGQFKESTSEIRGDFAG